MTAGRGRPSAEVLAVLIVAIGVYLNALPNEFVYDDAHYIVENPWLRDVGSLGQIFSTHSAAFAEEYTGNYYRPMMHMLYMAQYQLFGLRPWAFHLVNILLHAAGSALVVLVARRLAGNRDHPGGAGNIGPPTAPLLAGLLFATHPVHTESVAWLAGITDVSCALFFLLSLWLYLRAEEGRRGLRLLSGVAFFAACLAKEPALALLAVFAAYQAFARKVPVRQLPWRLLTTTWSHLVAAGAYAALRIHALGGVAPELVHRGLTPLETTWNALVLFAGYIGKLILPVGLNVLHVYRPVVSFGDPRLWLALGVMAAVTAAVFTTRNDATSIVAWTILLATLLPALYLPALGEYPFAERYLYLPSVGLVLLLARWWERLTLRWPRVATAGTVAALALLAAYGSATVVRNPAWRNSLTLWSDAVARSPDSAAAHEFLGNALSARERRDEAIVQYERALALDPNRPGSRINLGGEYARMERYDEAIVQYEAALGLGAGLAEAHNNLGLAHMGRGRIDRAVTHYLKSLEADPSFADAHNNLGVAYWHAGDLPRALERFEAAARLEPHHPIFRENASKLRQDLGR